ncbi:hypothetical protein [Streptomyces achromogenes]|uniref:hypothetical protein n=1 Tax=Streptomyces achromogenes TaxID=67255 RepID=UPI00343E3B8E
MGAGAEFGLDDVRGHRFDHVPRGGGEDQQAHVVRGEPGPLQRVAGRPHRERRGVLAVRDRSAGDDAGGPFEQPVRQGHTPEAAAIPSRNCRDVTSRSGRQEATAVMPARRAGP